MHFDTSLQLVVISRREELGSKLLPPSPDFLMMKIKSNFELPIRYGHPCSLHVDQELPSLHVVHGNMQFGD